MNSVNKIVKLDSVVDKNIIFFCLDLVNTFNFYSHMKENLVFVFCYIFE